MAEKDGDGPSLELPSLGFGRKRGKKARKADPETPIAPEPAEAPTAPVETVEPARPTEPAAPAEPEPVEPEPGESEPADAETVLVEAQKEPATTPMPPVMEPPPSPPPLFADEVQDSPTRTEAPSAGGERKEPRPKREFRLPAISPMAASLVTGAVVGVLMVGLTGAGFRFCELVQGAPSCGDPGFLLLLAIVIVIILVGKALLDAWNLPDPGSTSFLAVGLLSVVALLFLVDVLFNWWMIIVIPVLSMLCFALSHWVTTAFVDGDE